MIRSFLISALLASFIISCKTVPVTGRKQLNIVPDFMIKELAFSGYDSIIRFSRTLSVNDERAAMVVRIGTKIRTAVETYMQQNNFQKDLRHLSWELNTIDENIVNAWCMPGGKVVVYTGLLRTLIAVFRSFFLRQPCQQLFLEDT